MSFQHKTTEELLSIALDIEHLTKKASKAKTKKQRKKRIAKLQAVSTELAEYFLDLHTKEKLPY